MLQQALRRVERHRHEALRSPDRRAHPEELLPRGYGRQGRLQGRAPADGGPAGGAPHPHCGYGEPPGLPQGPGPDLRSAPRHDGAPHAAGGPGHRRPAV